MEELSIEQKAKAYDEAIDKIADVVEAGTIEQGLAEWLFPELCESEDEKIRKKIIALFKGQIPYTSKEDNEKFIAWLEKQCQVKESVISQNEDEQIRKGLIQYFSTFTLDTFAGLEPKKILSWLEKQGNKPQVEKKKLKAMEQKYIPKHKVGDTIYYNSFGELKSMIVSYITTDSTDNPMYEDENGSAVFEKDLVEQKPTDEEMKEALRTEYEKGRADAFAEMQKGWSEEDEKILNILISSLARIGASTRTDSTSITYTFSKEIDWLKSLKDRIQSKVELTQLDKNILEAAIAFVEHNNHFNCWRGVDKRTVLSALHSLRPQNTWKPSDEQMNILFKYAEQNNKDGSILTSLYQDLKKLREE